MSRSYLLKPYVVLYRDDTLEPADPPFGFDCQAEDGDHAEEQCRNAYPEADVVWVAWVAERVATLDEAYEDYYNDKGAI